MRCLVMGGQACVLYGGAEFSRDLDLEEQREREADQAYRRPLILELEQMRRDRQALADAGTDAPPPHRGAAGLPEPR